MVPTDDQLWVEKYTSQRFFDLLTEEVTNRNVITWMKSWDEIVFPERSKVSLKLPDSIASAPGIMFKKEMSFRKVDEFGNVYWATADQEFCW